MTQTKTTKPCGCTVVKDHMGILTYHCDQHNPYKSIN